MNDLTIVIASLNPYSKAAGGEASSPTLAACVYPKRECIWLLSCYADCRSSDSRERTKWRITSVCEREVFWQYFFNSSTSFSGIRTFINILFSFIPFTSKALSFTIARDALKMTKHLLAQVSLVRFIHSIALGRGWLCSAYITEKTHHEYITTTLFSSRGTSHLHENGGG